MKIDRIKQVMLDVVRRRDMEGFIDRIESSIGDVSVNIAFLGEVKSGKSTLVNALIRRELLPVLDEPTTAAITELWAGEKEKFEMVQIQEDGSERYKSISESELADYIIGRQKADKVNITLPPTGVLRENFRIVDTPGVHSLKDTHDDITFGYLPFVDVAFIVLDIRYGSATKSVLDFLTENFSEDFFSRIYFVVTKMDLKPRAEWEKIRENFNESVRRVIPHGEVLLVSGKMGLEGVLEEDIAKINESNINAIERIVLEDVVQKKEQIQNQKVLKELKEIAQQVIENLRVMQDGLSWNIPEFKMQLEKLKGEISNFQQKQREIEDAFQNAKTATIVRVNELIDILVPKLVEKRVNHEDCSELVQTLAEETIETIETQLKSVLEKADLDFKRKIPMLETMIGSALPHIDSTVKLANVLSDIITVGLTILIIPGPQGAIGLGEAAGAGGVAGAKAISRVAKKSIVRTATRQSFLKGLARGVGQFIKRINPVEQILVGLIATGLSKKKLQKKLRENLEKGLNQLFDSVSSEVNALIQQEYILPCEERRKAMQSIRLRIEKHRVKVKEEYNSLQQDIDTLEGLFFPNSEGN